MPIGSAEGACVDLNARMMPEFNNVTSIKWKIFGTDEHVYTVCEKEMCFDSLRTARSLQPGFSSEDGMYFITLVLS